MKFKNFSSKKLVEIMKALSNNLEKATSGFNNRIQECNFVQPLFEVFRENKKDTRQYINGIFDAMQDYKNLGDFFEDVDFFGIEGKLQRMSIKEKEYIIKQYAYYALNADKQECDIIFDRDAKRYDEALRKIAEVEE